MKTVLLVDDDATIVEIYRQRFVREGFQVVTAGDGVEATRMLRANRPDLVVLDLMMPRLSGVDVLKFIRTQPDLKATPVAIFTNAFMTELADAANELGIQRGIVKAECTPDALVAVAKDILSGAGAPPASGAEFAKASSRSAEATEKMRQHFLDHAPDTIATLRTLLQEFTQATDQSKQVLRLDGLFRKVHFVSALAGLSGYPRIALLGGAFEALLFELQQRPAHIGPSTVNTIAMTTDFLKVLFDAARNIPDDQPPSAHVLVVDDDPLSNHIAIAALRHANLNAVATENPLTALDWLQQTHYDLVLLDIEMPYMTGFDVCRKLRALPGYARTQVIYFTAHSDFESRATGILSGGNDLIAKPIFPYELALKAVMHLIQSGLPTKPSGQ
jgi:CheY-like chemotaxis protein